MALDIDAWLTDTNECTNINLTRGDEDIFPESFNPQFTYPIFGEDEKVVGYQGLDIKIRFRSHDLKPSLKVRYKRKIAIESEEIKQSMEVEPKLREFLPTGTEHDAEVPSTDTNAANWVPPGELQQSYSSDGKTYEIWCSTLLDDRAKDILGNMSILIPFFIEGGTCNFLDDPDWTLERWKLFLVYEVSNAQDTAVEVSRYCLAGFGTSYRNWVFPTEAIRSAFPTPPPELQTDPKLSEVAYDPETAEASMSNGNSNAVHSFSPINTASRERISQFLILPPFHGAGHGTRLYNAMTSLFLQDHNVFEITVEDPNETFDDMRDYCDLPRLVADPEFTSFQLATKVDEALLTSSSQVPESALIVNAASRATVQHKHKLAPRQFARLLEMYLLSTIPPRHRSINRITRKHRASDENDRKYYFWRLLVKARVWKRNKDSLMQLEEGERIDKLEETVEAVLEEYTRILEGFEKRKAYAPVDGSQSASGVARAKARKRKLVDDDEDDDEDGHNGVQGKKSKA